MPSIWIKNPLAIFTAEPTDAAKASGGIVIRDGVVAELLGPGLEPTEAVDQVFDASLHVVLPGLINTHHHFFQTLTRALKPALDKELFHWLQALYPVWAHLTPEMLDLATELALSELLLSGCTTTSDHHYVFPDGLETGIDVQAAAASRVGLRVVLSRGSMDLSEKDGGLPPDSVVQDPDTILADSERLIQRYHQAGDGARVQIALAPCSPFSVSPEVMRRTAALAEKYQVGLHTHLAETQDEADYCQEKFGQTPLDYLEACGWLTNRTWLAHGIHFSAPEIHRLARAGTAISTCAHSNMTLSSGICPVCDMEAAGVTIGMGVDGSASNDASNMIEEVRQCLLLQRLRFGAGKVSHIDAIRWATKGSAGCLNRTDIGEIALGKQADLALFRLNEMRYSGYDDPLAALILCGASRADRVMIAGDWKVIDARIPGLDEAGLIDRHSAMARKLRQAAGL